MTPIGQVESRAQKRPRATCDRRGHGQPTEEVDVPKGSGSIETPELDWIIASCREIVRMDNWLAELSQREKHAAGRFDPRECRQAEERLWRTIGELRDRLSRWDGRGQ